MALETPAKLLPLLEKGKEDKKSSKSVKFYKENLDSVLTQVGTLPVSIISVVGPDVPASFLLLCYLINHLQTEEEEPSQSTPINWGEETNPPKHITGSWILNRPIFIRNSAILLLYSHSSEQDFLSEDSIMNALVGLDLRLSSLTIITSMDKLSLEFLSKVATFIKYGKEGEESPQISFEELAFFIPNWNLVSRFPLGKEGGQTLLQKMLSVSPPEVEDAIFKYFSSVHSHLAPKLGESFDNPEPEFIASLQTFVSGLVSSDESLEKKVRTRKRITAIELKTMFETHLTKFNLQIEIEGNLEEAPNSPQTPKEYASKRAFFQKLTIEKEKQIPSKEKPTSSKKKYGAPPPPPPPPKNTSRFSKRPPSPPPPPRPRPAKLFEENPTQNNAIDLQNPASVQGMVKEGTKKYHAFMSSLIKNCGRDYPTETGLDKSHLKALKKTLESFPKEEEAEKKVAFEKKLTAQLERELSSLKQQHEEQRQLFLEELIAELVLKYKSRFEQESTGSWKQASKILISNLVADLKSTLEANHDEDDWALLQLESRLGKLEEKYEALKETDMVELSELTEMGIDFAVNDYKNGMEKYLGEKGNLQKSLEEMHEELKEKCLEELEETLGKEWDNDVEKKLELRLAVLYQEFEGRLRGKGNQQESKGKNSKEIVKLQI
ncbi:unnamed protein product [Orchesella dallaii]|uniref:GB1/RHD3-type G domain-containing protein n=1 Tax=Orchesella dallaii TaxID=48710 RepID=A0ABP1RVA3_9HEXA